MTICGMVNLIFSISELISNKGVSCSCSVDCSNLKVSIFGKTATADKTEAELQKILEEVAWINEKLCDRFGASDVAERVEINKTWKSA